MIMFFVEPIIASLLTEFDRISPGRRDVLTQITKFIETHKVSNLVFICTHNSRRSHIAQIWAETAAAYFEARHVSSFSGGTEATAFNPRAVDALRGIGLRINVSTPGVNPRYTVSYSDTHPAFDVFSKRYDSPGNPSNDFAAIMTCTHADENCPVVNGASARISLPYDDPKDFDGTDLEATKYAERALEIGREILFVFSQIKKPL